MNATHTDDSNLVIVDNIQTLRNTTANEIHAVMTRGYYFPGDGGGGTYVYQDNDTWTQDNGGDIIATLCGSRHWKLVEGAGQTVRQFGALGNNIHNDTVALNNAFAAGTQAVPSGFYFIDDITLLHRLSEFDGNGIFMYKGQAFPVGPVTGTLDFHVPSVFTTIQEALTCIERLDIRSGKCDIHVADGEYDVTQMAPHINCGQRVNIYGNIKDASRCVLKVDNRDNQTCFNLQHGWSLGIIDGFTIIGQYGWLDNGKWQTQSYGSGVRATYGSTVQLGSQMVIDKMYYGLQAKYGASIQCGPHLRVHRAGDCGVHAFAASIECLEAEVSACIHHDDDNDLGFGITAEAGGFVDATGSKVSGNLKAGFYSNGGRMWASNGQAFSNQTHGFFAFNGGTIEANYSLASNNTQCGFVATNNSFILAFHASASSNGKGFGAWHNSSIDINGANAIANIGVGFLAVDSSVLSHPSTASNNKGHDWAIRGQSICTTPYTIQNNGDHNVHTSGQSLFKVGQRYIDINEDSK